MLGGSRFHSGPRVSLWSTRSRALFVLLVATFIAVPSLNSGVLLHEISPTAAELSGGGMAVALAIAVSSRALREIPRPANWSTLEL